LSALIWCICVIESSDAILLFIIAFLFICNANGLLLFFPEWFIHYGFSAIVLWFHPCHLPEESGGDKLYMALIYRMDASLELPCLEDCCLLLVSWCNIVIVNVVVEVVFWLSYPLLHCKFIQVASGSL
jgi:hypothetical protein